MLRLVNKARAVVGMYSHASLIIPLAIPQRLPSNIMMDKSSPWHTSALFNAAMESTSLFTRLRTTDQVNNTSLGNTTDLLNVFGKQVIANLQFSLAEPPQTAQNGTNGQMQLPIGRGEMYDRLNALEFEERPDPDAQNDLSTLEIDLSTIGEGINSSNNYGRGRKRHLFSQITTARGEDATRGFDEDEPTNGHEYRRRERPKTHK